MPPCMMQKPSLSRNLTWNQELKPLSLQEGGWGEVKLRSVELTLLKAITAAPTINSTTPLFQRAWLTSLAVNVEC
jgi:hypothetical protein